MAESKSDIGSQVNRREFVGVAMAGGVAASLPVMAQTSEPEARLVNCAFTINKRRHEMQVDPRVTLLDLLREHLKLTGTKKGCDHGQCGACTVLLEGRRMNACMTLAIMQNGREITTVEGLADSSQLHPMQAAFIENDALQCGYCTPGQICSAVALLEEVKTGAPSAATPHIADIRPIELSDDEIRERMSGNICRCGAYEGIVAAVREAARRRPA